MQLVERKDELAREVSRLEERKMSLLHDEQKQQQLELKQEKEHKRELAKETKRDRQLEKSIARRNDLAEISGVWNAIFGRDLEGRGFLERFGAFGFKYLLTYACTFFSITFLAGGFIYDHPKEQLILLGLDISSHLLAFYFGSRGWRGYTKLAYHHQRLWGIGATFFVVFTIASVFVDTSFVKWLFIRPE